MRPPGLDVWTSRGLRFGLGVATTGVGVLAGIARNKWVAWHLDTTGIGVVGQVTACQTWIGLAAALGLGLALTRVTGAALGSGDDARARRAVWTALGASGLATALAVVVVLAAAPWIAAALLGSATYAPLVRISVLGAAGYAAYSLVTGIFAGRSDVRAPLTLALFGGAAAVAATFLLVPRTGLVGAVLAVSLMLPAGVAGALLVHGRAYRAWLAPPPRPLVDRRALPDLLGIGVASLTLALFDQGVLLAARAHYVQAYSVEANGLFQAALALSQQVGAVFYLYLASYALGRVSGLPGVEATRDYTRRQWRPLLLLAAVAFALAMLLAGPLIRLLYTERFDPARPMAAWMLLGEFGKVALQAWAIGSLPLGGTRRWLLLMLLFPAVLGIAYVALAGTGPLALPLSYLAAGLVSVVVVGVAMSRMGVSLAARDVALLVVVFAALALLARTVAGV